MPRDHRTPHVHMPLANPADLPALVAACRAILSSTGPIEVAEEYSYASLPLCVIDAVFSIGVRHESGRNQAALAYQFTRRKTT